MSHASPCPDVALLERLRAGAVTEPERKAVERHLEICDACNGKLEAMAYDEEGSPRPIACPDRSVLRRLADGIPRHVLVRGGRASRRGLRGVPGRLRGPGQRDRAQRRGRRPVPIGDLEPAARRPARGA